MIGLPVSTGYGRGGAGEGALNTMLQSCSTGLVVVNIDNKFDDAVLKACYDLGTAISAKLGSMV